MKQLSTKKAIFLSGLLFFVVLISGCSAVQQDKLWVKSEGWSRAINLGETGLAGPVPYAADPDRKIISVLFPKVGGEGNQYYPELVILSEQGELQNRIPIDLQISKPSQAEILYGEDSITLFWLDSFQLSALQFDHNGRLQSAVWKLTGEERVSKFSVIRTPEGVAIACSGNKENPGTFVLLGDLSHLEKVDIDPQGVRLNQFLDQEGRYHLGWIRYPKNYGDFEVYYLESDLPELDPASSILLYSKNITPAIRVTGPAMGLDEGLVYFFWSESIVSGLDVGAQDTFMQYFPLGFPDQARPPMTLGVPATQILDQVDYTQGYYQVGKRVLMKGNYPRTSFLDNMSVLPEGYPEMAIAFRSDSEFKWRDVRSQVNVAFIQDGLLTSFQPISYTSLESNFPHLQEDQDHNLYLTWLEKDSATFNAFLSTTDPEKRANLDLVDSQDYLVLAAEGIFGILAGVVLSPFAAAAWGGAGLIAFLFNLILSQFGKPLLKKIGEFLSVVGGVYIFWWLKMATLPGLFGDYVPFSAWIPRIPQALDRPLIYGVPVLIGLISLAVAWSKTYGKDAGSAINFHMIYSGVDALLSCAVYGILIYGSF